MVVLIILIFNRTVGEMIQFDLRIFLIPIFYSALFGALSVEGWLEYFQPPGHGRFMLRGVGREDALQPVHEGWTKAAWMHPSG